MALLIQTLALSRLDVETKRNLWAKKICTNQGFTLFLENVNIPVFPEFVLTSLKKWMPYLQPL